MSTYFKPWRRRFGVMTLMLAGMFMAGWVRSLVVRDFVHRSENDGSCIIEFESSNVNLLWWSSSKDHFKVPPPLKWQTGHLRLADKIVESHGFRWTAKLPGLAIGEIESKPFPDGSMRRRLWTAPHLFHRHLTDPGVGLDAVVEAESQG